MTDTQGQSQPESHDLVILLGSGSVIADSSQLRKLGVKVDAPVLRGDYDQPPGTNQRYPHFRNALASLNISQLEADYNQWFHKLKQYLGQFAEGHPGIEYQSVNLLLTGSATIYLRLFEYYEEFICAIILLEEYRPGSILIIANPAESAATLFIQSLTYLAGLQGTPVKHIVGEEVRKATRRNYASSVYKALQKEIKLLSISIANILHRRIKPGNIFCVDENSYNIPIYLPAFENLIQHKRPLFPYFLSSNNAVLNSAVSLAQTAVSPYEGLNIGEIFIYGFRLRAYLKAIDRLCQEDSFKDLFSWSGTNVWPLIHKGLHKLLVRLNIKMLWYLPLIDRMLARYKPQAVLTTYGLAHFRTTVIELAKIRHIPTTIIQNAAIPHQLLWGLLPDHPMLVWGRGTKEFLVSLGAREEQIQVVGPTKYNQLGSRLPEINRDQEVRKLGFAPDRPLILYTANFTGAWGEYYDWETTELLMRVITRQLQYQLMITLHPRCTQHIVEKVARLETDRIKLLKSLDMPLLYRVADVGVTQFSTTAIDASIFGLPIISVLPHNRPDWLGMGKLGAALIARDENQLAAQLDLVLNNEQVRAEIQRGQKAYHAWYLNGLDGLANSRINDHILDCIRCQTKIDPIE